MSTCEVIKNYIEENGIKQSFVANRAEIPRELLRRSLEGNRTLKADEFIKICNVLSIDLKMFEDVRTERLENVTK